MKKINKKEFRPSEDTLRITPGEMLQTIRDLQGLTQSKLSKMTGISQPNISALKKEPNKWVGIGLSFLPKL
jgi:transcriptional regulator with XRE-family HTH domain